jgi:hypothetical protein
MGISGQKWLKKRMDSAWLICVFALFFAQFAAPLSAQQAPPVQVDPQPPRVSDLPRPTATPRALARPSPSPSPAAVRPAPTLEQSLVPEQRAVPADPKARALDNLKRAVPAQQVQTQPRSTSAQVVERVEVEGLRPQQRDEVKEAFDRNLRQPGKTGVETYVRDDGARCTVNHDCRGPGCAVLCTGTQETMGNRKMPDGINLIQR